jgi:hypothetical protein
MKYKTVRNPYWANAEQTVINCEVDFDDLIEEFVPFSASESGMYDHEKEIFQKAKAGAFGEVAAYTPPPPLTTEQKADMARFYRDQMLKELDALVSNPLRWNSFSEETKQNLAQYRQALLDVPSQAGFPDNVNWPTPPSI